MRFATISKISSICFIIITLVSSCKKNNDSTSEDPSTPETFQYACKYDYIRAGVKRNSVYLDAKGRSLRKSDYYNYDGSLSTQATWAYSNNIIYDTNTDGSLTPIYHLDSTGKIDFAIRNNNQDSLYFEYNPMGFLLKWVDIDRDTYYTIENENIVKAVALHKPSGDTISKHEYEYYTDQINKMPIEFCALGPLASILGKQSKNLIKKVIYNKYDNNHLYPISIEEYMYLTFDSKGRVSSLQRTNSADTILSIVKDSIIYSCK